MRRAAGRDDTGCMTTLARGVRIDRRGATRVRRRRHAAHLDADARQPVSLEGLGASWWSAFDAAEAALWAARASLGAQELRERVLGLSSERSSTVELLEAVARAEGGQTRFSHLLLSRSSLKRLLGLPSALSACVFSLDGVLVASAPLHLAAWAETLDGFIAARVERTGGRFASFNPRTDDERYLHGRPRLEGVRAFLASRGISLPEGGPGDPPGAETLHGLANRKNEALLRRLDEQGVRAFAGSRRYLETAREAGLRTAVVSTSTTAGTVLERAGLASLVDVRVDGDVLRARQLAAGPTADILLAACELLDVEPERAAAFETSTAGVAAARVAGFGLVVGVDPAGRAAPLHEQGADIVVTSLGVLFERNLPLSAPIRSYS